MIKKLLPVTGLLILVFTIQSYGFQDGIAAELKTVPIGQTVLDFIDAINSGDIEKMRAFHVAHGGQPDFAEQDLGLAQETGGVKPSMVLKLTESNIELLVQAKKDSRWMIIEFQIGNSPPYPLRGLDLRPGSPPDSMQKETKDEPSAASEAEAVSKLGARLDELVKNDQFSGIVMVAKVGKPVFQKAYGFADKESNELNRIDTKFNLGSINKIFTRIAIAGLVEQGKLSLDDKLGKILPDYPNREAREKVTVGQLVEMKSGIGDFFNERFDAAPKEKIRSLKDYLPFFADKPLEFEPGTGKRYSNGGYLVLGLIIEKVSGMDYYAYVNKNIFQPAGMNNTASFGTYEKIPRLARGYTMEGAEGGEGVIKVMRPPSEGGSAVGKRVDKTENLPEGDIRADVGRVEHREGQPGIRNAPGIKRVLNTKSLPGRGSSAGGGYSTAPDMLKFTEALNAGKFKTDPGKQFRGLGVAGGAPGINAVLEAEPTDGYTIIVMSNYDPPSAEDLGRFARGLFSNLPK